jgi:hypothetical protein
LITEEKNIYGRHLAARVILALQDLLSSGNPVTNRSISEYLADQHQITSKSKIKALNMRVSNITRELIRDGYIRYEERRNSKRSMYYVFTQISSKC